MSLPVGAKTLQMYVEEARRRDGGDVTVSLAVEGLDKYFRSVATFFSVIELLILDGNLSFWWGNQLRKKRGCFYANCTPTVLPLLDLSLEENTEDHVSTAGETRQRPTDSFGSRCWPQTPPEAPPPPLPLLPSQR